MATISQPPQRSDQQFTSTEKGEVKKEEGGQEQKGFTSQKKLWQPKQRRSWQQFLNLRKDRTSSSQVLKKGRLKKKKVVKNKKALPAKKAVVTQTKAVMATISQPPQRSDQQFTSTEIGTQTDNNTTEIFLDGQGIAIQHRWLVQQVMSLRERLSAAYEQEHKENEDHVEALHEIVKTFEEKVLFFRRKEEQLRKLCKTQNDLIEDMDADSDGLQKSLGEARQKIEELKTELNV
eukprot:TRINITY_DN17182_c0_g1_i7.p2 TRINITY_DN17182_c0_g1~~TRINITY_DN17182_c0_g1_i7.p2  ORF type:complete len:234 (+),score=29.76 TRINITY_DN17182_c0_g1_i7:127-828(+)